jgi:hypothetical protein
MSNSTTQPEEVTSPERHGGSLITTIEGNNGERRDLDVDESTTCDPGVSASPATGLEDVPLTFPQRVRVLEEEHCSSNRRIS